jgi:hypothetical protein
MTNILTPIFYLILLFLTLSCEKESIISTTVKSSKIIGLTNFSFLGGTPPTPINLAIINNVTGLDSARVPLLSLGLSSIQGMTLPNGDYLFHSSILGSSASRSSNIYLYPRNRKPATLRTFATGTSTLTNGLVYSPVSKLNYAVQADSVIQFELDSISLKVLKKRVYPGLKCGTIDLEKNSTIHPTKPFMYIAGKNNVRRLDINTGQYLTLTDTTKANIYGIRYNLHDNQVYMLYSQNNSTRLIVLNPETNVFSLVFTIPDIRGIASDDYSATIHCCKNQYILYQGKMIYTIDIANKTSKRQQTNNICQGLVWVQE